MRKQLSTNADQRKSIHSRPQLTNLLQTQYIPELEAVAVKRDLVWQLAEAMRQQKKTKQAMAQDLQTSRSQLARLLDPENISVSLETITRAANVLGRRIVVVVADAPDYRKQKLSRRKKAVARVIDDANAQRDSMQVAS
jgi:transcriptional regulator with XRE-family HTH domain